MEDCRQCNGTGVIFLRPNLKRIPFIKCEICNGSGKEISLPLWRLQGQIIKELRKSQNFTLREYAKKYRIDPSNLSKMERGFIKPDATLVRISCAYKN